MLPDSSPEREQRALPWGLGKWAQLLPGSPWDWPTGLETKSDLESSNTLRAWVNFVPVSQTGTSLEDPSLAKVYRGPGRLADENGGSLQG